MQKDSWDIDYQATLNLLTAARQNKASHFVLLSAICVQKPLLEFQHAKLKFEAALQAAGDITYSIVRPTAFFKSLAGQVSTAIWSPSNSNICDRCHLVELLHHVGPGMPKAAEAYTAQACQLRFTAACNDLRCLRVDDFPKVVAMHARRVFRSSAPKQHRFWCGDSVCNIWCWAVNFSCAI